MKRHAVSVESKLKLARTGTFLSYGLLVLVLTVRAFAIGALAPGAQLVMALLFSLPLLSFLPGMLRGNHKTFIWLCFVVLIYFLVLTNNMFRPGAGPADWLSLGLVCGLFISAMLFARWKQRAPSTE